LLDALFLNKESHLRIASWVLTILLGIVLFYACAQLPAPGDTSSHISIRYVQKSQAETGIGSPVGAVMGDYRSFDLLMVGALFFTSLLALFLFFPGSLRLGAWFPAILGLTGFAAMLVLGFLSLLHGSNFLDYEALANWTAAPQARLDGALILTGSVLLGLGGFLLLAVRWAKVPEGPGER
jgi:hypothetical protein